MSFQHQPASNRKLHSFSMISLGCAKNLVDSEVLIDTLKKMGLTWVLDEKKADLIVIKTCCFINDAREEAINTILEYASRKKAMGFKLVVGGCLVQRYRHEVEKLMPEVDGWFGVEGFQALPRIIEELSEGRSLALIQDVPSAYREYEGRESVTPRSWRYLKIAEGCSHRCTFCIIPSIRGAFRSRTMESVVNEARELVAGGCRELDLIAQDSGVYGTDLYGEKRLAHLLEELQDIDDLRWIRVLYINPHSLDDRVLDVMAKSTRIVRYLDIPFQHSSEPVVKRMRRPGNGRTYLELLARIRDRMPDVAIRSSFIIGFPGETEEDFDNLCQFLTEARLTRAGFFLYSREEGSAAYSLPDQLHHQTARKRLRKIAKLQEKISEELNARRRGTAVQVMIDKKKDHKDSKFLKGIAGGLRNFIVSGKLDKEVRYLGRTTWDAPEIDGTALVLIEKKAPGKEHPLYNPGDVVTIDVEGTSAFDVAGYIKDSPSAEGSGIE